MTTVKESKVQSQLFEEGFRNQSFAILSDQPFYYLDRVCYFLFVCVSVWTQSIIS